jgi:hypothetical protein
VSAPRRRTAAPVAAVALAAVALVTAGAPGARAQGSPVCLGDLSAAGVPQLPGERLRMGINPAGEAGALGPRVEPVPENPPRTLAALRELAPPSAPMVVRLNRFFWSEGEAGIRRFLALANRYSQAGYLVELQLRYHPRAEQEGDVEGFVAWVRDVVRRVGANRRVVAVQVTNEVNLTFSPDSSDGAYRGARDALVRGVIAAKDEARARGYRHLTVGFNWFFRTDTANEEAFWAHLASGGQRFVSSVDWVGLDAYPGTVFPPVEYPGGERDGMVAAMSSLRQCWMPKAGLGANVPIHVEENGWPTGPARTEDMQAQAMRAMVGAVHDFRGTYNVTDYRWFDLRDHRTSSANFQHQYGLLRDDYSPKPAFGVYRQLLRELSRLGPRPRPASRPRVRLAIALRARRTGRGRRRCALPPVLAALRGRDVRRVRRVAFAVPGRRARSDARRPFMRALPVRRARRARTVRVTADVTLRGGTRIPLARRLRVCGR